MSAAWLLPLLPALGVLALAMLPPGRGRAGADLGIGALTLLAALALCVVSAAAERAGLVTAVLVALLGLLDRLAVRPRPMGWSRMRRHARDAALLVGVLSPDPFLAWGGLVAAAAVLLAPPSGRSAHHAPAGAAAGLALFGLIGVAVAPAMGLACVALGQVGLVALVPGLLPAAPVLVLRLRDLADTHAIAAAPVLLAVIGLGGATLAAWMAWRGHAAAKPARLALGQAGLGLCAIGLMVPQARFAGFFHLLLVGLAQAAPRLAAPGRGLDRAASLAGLSGLPPLGVFPSLALVLLAAGQQGGLVALPAALAAAGLAAAGLAALPAPARWAPSLAWVPLGLALLVGFAMPAPLAAWLSAGLAVGVAP